MVFLVRSPIRDVVFPERFSGSVFKDVASKHHVAKKQRAENRVKSGTKARLVRFRKEREDELGGG
jgi:hypothetical protein